MANFQVEADLWLDADHYILWATADDGRRIGGILGHRRADNKTGFCEGSFWFEKTRHSGALWTFNGDFEKPTLTPSFFCHCKTCHIFIRDGKVIDAGCTHNPS